MTIAVFFFFPEINRIEKKIELFYDQHGIPSKKITFPYFTEM